MFFTLQKFTTEDVKLSLNTCHECITMRYYTQEKERLFLLDIENGTIWDIEKTGQQTDLLKSGKLIDELILLRSKTYYVHAFDRFKLQEIWNLTTTEIDLYSYLEYSKNKERNELREHEEFDVHRIQDNSLEIKRKNDNKAMYRIETAEKITGVYAIDVDSGKFHRIKIKYSSSNYE